MFKLKHSGKEDVIVVWCQMYKSIIITVIWQQFLALVINSIFAHFFSVYVSKTILFHVKTLCWLVMFQLINIKIPVTLFYLCLLFIKIPSFHRTHVWLKCAGMTLTYLSPYTQQHQLSHHTNVEPWDDESLVYWLRIFNGKCRKMDRQLLGL